MSQKVQERPPHYQNDFQGAMAREPLAWRPPHYQNDFHGAYARELLAHRQVNGWSIMN